MAEKQQALTRYNILTSGDEGRTAELLGDALATSSEQALRKWFAEPPRDEQGDAWFAAVSQNAMRWRQVAAKTTVKTTISEPQAQPRLAAVEPPVEPESLKV